jgi:hypothetical protein
MENIHYELKRDNSVNADNSGLNTIGKKGFFFLVGLPLYFALMALPLQYARTYYQSLSIQFSGTVRRYQIIAVIAFLLCSILSGSLHKKNSFTNNTSMIIAWGLLIFWFAASSTWSVNQMGSALYAILLIGIILSGAFFWLSHDREIEQASSLTSITIIVTMAYLGVVLPIGARSFGGITPNELGHFGFSAIVLGYLSRKRSVILLSFGLGLALIIFSQARTVFISLVIFISMVQFISLYLTTRSRLQIFIGLSLFFGLTASLFGEFFSGLVFSAVTSGLGVTDVERGAGSGLSGRVRSWEIGRDLLEGHELLGYGFRTRGSLDYGVGGVLTSAHSGLLNAALDTGLIGCIGFVLVVLMATWYTLNSWVKTRSNTDRIVGCFLISMWPILVIEPNYLNFAAPTTFLMAICLSKPLVFRSLT